MEPDQKLPRLFLDPYCDPHASINQAKVKFKLLEAQTGGKDHAALY